MKAILSILLGLMLLTSLVGFSYATPITQAPQPLDNDNNNNCQNPYNPQISNSTNATRCGAHSDGNDPKDPPHCTLDSKAPDGACCFSSNPISPDSTCCPVSINPQNPQLSDMQPDCPG